MRFKAPDKPIDIKLIIGDSDIVFHFLTNPDRGVYHCQLQSIDKETRRLSAPIYSKHYSNFKGFNEIWSKGVVFDEKTGKASNVQEI